MRECEGTVQQPDPVKSKGDCWLMVMADMEARRKFGIEKYGTPVQAGNGRDVLVDIYQELLDAAVYMKQLMEERKMKGVGNE